MTGGNMFGREFVRDSSLQTEGKTTPANIHFISHLLCGGQ